MKINPFLILLFVLSSPFEGFAQIEHSWCYGFESNTNNLFNNVLTDNENSIYITGNYLDSINLDPNNNATTLSSEQKNSFLAKYSENGDFIWAKNLNLRIASGDDIHSSPIAKVDNENNILIYGYKETAYSHISKHDKNGNLLFELEFENISSSSYSLAEALQILPNNDFIIAGNFFGEINITGTNNTSLSLQSNGNKSYYFVKYNSFGEIIWHKTIGKETNNNLKIYNLHIDNQENIFIAGRMTGVYDFEPDNTNSNSELSATDGEAFFVKYDSMGNFLFGKVYNSIANSFITGLKTDSENNIVIIGRFGLSIELVDSNNQITELTGSGMSSGFIAKLDENGNLIFAYRLFSNLTDMVKSVLIDDDDNIHITGFFHGSSLQIESNNQNISMGNLGAVASFYCMYSSSGNLLEHFSLSGEEQNDGVGFWSISFTSNKSFIVCGQFHGENINFDVLPNQATLTTSKYNGFIAKYTNPLISPIAEILLSNNTGFFYPNPINKNVKIQTIDTVEKIEIYDLNGKLISSIKSSSVLSPNKSGIYILKAVDSNNKIFSGKILVK